VIRELRREDAEAVAQLALTVNPHRIETAELIWQRASTAPREARRRDWVAEAALLRHSGGAPLGASPESIGPHILP